MSFEVPLTAGSESVIRLRSSVLRGKRVLTGELEWSDGDSCTNALIFPSDASLPSSLAEVLNTFFLE